MSGRGQRRKAAAGGPTAGVVPAPQDVLEYPIGEERKIPDWPAMVEYFWRLAAASDRVVVEELGRTTADNPFIAVTIASPENLARRDQNRDILRQLFDPRGTAPEEVEALVAEGRPVAMLLCTQHSSELGAALMTLELAHDLATGDEPATREILDNAYTLIVPCANPDGHRMVAEWYARWLGTEYEGREMPWLYHPYVGHDNNRDWFMLTQAETRLVAALHNREHPQLVFDMHQMQRDGARFMVPPFIDPLDPNQDPVIQQGFADLGTAIATRLTAAGKAGVSTHIIFDNYSPSLSYGNYHGSVDLLSEAASCKLATPVDLDEDDLKEKRGFDPRARTWNHPLPWKGGKWTLRDIVEYDKLAALAFLEHAAKYRAQWLRNYAGIMRRTVERADPPHAFLIPAEQDDPPTAHELLATLARGAVEVLEATAPFTADGVAYPAGTRIVRLGQPAGNFAKTLLEVQHYPDLRQWPDGPPRPPYDIAGHTLPLQMGVRAVQVAKPFEAQTRPFDCDARPAGTVEGDGTYGYAVVPATNRSAQALNRLLAAGHRVYRNRERLAAVGLPPGAMLVPRNGDRDLDRTMRALAGDLGVEVRGLEAPLDVAGYYEQTAPRLGLYQSWKPSMDEGWTRFILEDYEFPYTTLHDADVKAGGLAARFDTIVLPQQSREDLLEGNKEKNDYKEPYPPEYVGGLGELGLAALRDFVEAGGTLVALDSACEAVVKGFWLPVRNVLEGLDRKDFYCPGSLLRIVVDPSHPLGYGLRREETAVFINSPAFELAPGAEGRIAARYPLSDPNLSGWILGAEHLAGKAALLELPLGEGRVVLVGFRPQFRAQARGTYKVLFNAIYRGALRPAEA
ncbi:MAG TPA: M14 family zinc carboxypeptidase [Thermomicrobiales bacterium]|nr:M14 family zinc carboxypeptidase [Thermomicrobiales bacterium]